VLKQCGWVKQAEAAAFQAILLDQCISFCSFVASQSRMQSSCFPACKTQMCKPHKARRGCWHLLKLRKPSAVQPLILGCLLAVFHSAEVSILTQLHK
jgi:hypothetical protein